MIKNFQWKNEKEWVWVGVSKWECSTKWRWLGGGFRGCSKAVIKVVDFFPVQMLLSQLKGRHQKFIPSEFRYMTIPCICVKSFWTKIIHNYLTHKKSKPINLIFAISNIIRGTICGFSLALSICIQCIGLFI